MRHGIRKVITRIKNINKFIIRVLVRAGSHGHDLSDGCDIPKYPRNKRSQNTRCDATYKARDITRANPPSSDGRHADTLTRGYAGKGMATTSRSRRKLEDEKKNKKKQPPLDERPQVPAPSEAMLQNLRTAFGLLDRDSDGHVTPAELQFMLRNLGIEVSDDLIADLIKDASKTGNGLIDENEFMQWVTKIQALQGLDVTTSGGDSEEEITRDLLAAFKVFDRDDNGYITRDELRTALEIIGEPVTDAQLNQVLALGDIDHDGRIDYEEFVKMLL